jgi:opacity protein-like surface antigen
MNKVMKLIQMILLLAMTEIHAQNIGDVFGGISYLQTSIKDESSNNLGTFKPTVLGLGLAYVVLDNVALEANIFNGTSDSSLASRLGSVTVQVKNGYSLGVRPFMAFNESWGGYAKLGRQYGTQTLTQPKLVNRTVVTTPIDSSYAHTVYGLGVAYNIDRQWGVSTEYMWSKKGESENSKNASLGVGLRYKF